MLSLETFKTVIASTPLISIDFIVRNKRGEILLGKRTNRPAKGSWFVPGGRILKDESFESAFKRLLKAELGINGAPSFFKGLYQHFYDDNFSLENFTTHYVVLAYETEFSGVLSSLPIDQHSDYQWFDENELLLNESVHKHTKWYFQKDKQADLIINEF